MAAKRDYYDILGISKNASADEIKEAYRRLARKYHPDMNPDKDKKEAEEKFKELSEAYEVLIDPNKRSMYDQFGHSGVESQFGPGGFSWSNFTHFSDVEDIFGDLLGDFFGGFRGESIIDRLFGRGTSTGAAGRTRGADIQVTIPLSLQEIAHGVTKKIRLKRYEKCSSCNGVGGKGYNSCSTCGGSGQVKQVSSSIFGQFVNISSCPKCRGSGRIIKERCPECRGSGKVEKLATVSVNVPAGVSHGNYIPIRGQGNAGNNGGPPGDLIVVIDEKSDPIFKRDGADIFVRVPVSFSVITLGGNVEVPTLDGRVALRIPPGTQSGKIFKLRGKGLPKLNGYGSGDELVEVFVHTPVGLSREAEELIKKLDKLIGHPKVNTGGGEYG
ncbi:MAG: molecular chaperone DnaJ [bacterium]|nr:molecular chaperone DnaJ [bacterium]